MRISGSYVESFPQANNFHFLSWSLLTSRESLSFMLTSVVEKESGEKRKEEGGKEGRGRKKRGGGEKKEGQKNGRKQKE